MNHSYLDQVIARAHADPVELSESGLPRALAAIVVAGVFHQKQEEELAPLRRELAGKLSRSLFSTAHFSLAQKLALDDLQAITGSEKPQETIRGKKIVEAFADLKKNPVQAALPAFSRPPVIPISGQPVMPQQKNPLSARTA